jgi:DNA replication protein DnaC
VLQLEIRALKGSAQGIDEDLGAFWNRRREELAALGPARYRLKVSCPRWLSVSGTVAALRREMHNDERPTTWLVQAAIETKGIVVLDDLGTEKASDWTVETLSAIVCDRYDAARRTVVTSNLSAARLVDLGYDRIVSRLADDGILLELTSLSDYRMKLRQTVA